MLRHSLTLALASALLATGCSGGESDTKPKSSSTTAKVAKTGFATVGADDWADPSKWRVGELPSAPEGFSQQQLNQMAGIIDPWARAALLNAQVLKGQNVVGNVSSSLPPFLQPTFAKLVNKTPNAQLSAGNAFAPQPSGPSRLTSEWKVDLKSGPGGTPTVRLRLQVRAVYPVGDSVVGTIRNFGLSSPRGTTIGEALGLSSAWYVWGAEPCELLSKGVITPLADEAAAKKDLGLYADIVKREGFQESEALDVRSPDELKDTC